jgi:hypothetical protein
MTNRSRDVPIGVGVAKPADPRQNSASPSGVRVVRAGRVGEAPDAVLTNPGSFGVLLAGVA